MLFDHLIAILAQKPEKIDCIDLMAFSGKKRVFFVADFFETATKTTVLFFRGALIDFQKKLTNSTKFQFKFEVIRQCTPGVVQIHNQAFILT